MDRHMQTWRDGDEEETESGRARGIKDASRIEIKREQRIYIRARQTD